jgi:importin subunit alpha-1
MLKHDDIEIKKEAVWAVSNCTTCANVKLVELLVKQGLIEALVSVLRLQGVKMIAVALEGIDTLLKIGEDHYKVNGEN